MCMTGDAFVLDAAKLSCNGSFFLTFGLDDKVTKYI